MEFTSRPRLPGALIACAVVLAFAGCSTPGTEASPTPPASVQASALETPGQEATALPSATPSPAPTIVPSTNLDGITVVGDFGKEPTLTFTPPWAIDKTQVKVLSQGTGPEVTADATVEVNYHGVDGRTGTLFDESFTSGQPVAFPLSGVIPGFKTGLVGQKAGSRVLLAIAGADGYDASGGQPQAGIEVGDTLVFVIDLVATSLKEPSGTPVTPAPGLPTVSDDIAKPVITIAAGLTKPTSLVIQPLIKGTGRAVAANDIVRVNFAEVAWSTGKLVKQTYGYAPLDGALASTLPGWQKGLLDQAVGSRVLLVVPPADAYPAGDAKRGVGPDETMVYVIDILFASGS